MTSSFTTVSFTHRFAGPCRAKDLQPYARPDIVSCHELAEDGTLIAVPHVILRFGRNGKGRICLELKSERDEEFYGYWSGTQEEFGALLNPKIRELRLWNLTFRMSGRMVRILMDARNPVPV
jgi:hypothetical protein